MTIFSKEPQNQIQFDSYESSKIFLGPYTAHMYKHDPRHLGFLLARYKFVAKMLEEKKSVVEIGCGDGFGIPIVLQTVGHVHGIDFEPLLLNGNLQRLSHLSCTFSILDVTEDPIVGNFDAAYSLDVIEHIPKTKEDAYFRNVCQSIGPNGVFVVGTPNTTAQQYASEASREGHINLKSAPELRFLVEKYFHNCFMFSMNDEVVHTGYSPMAHYIIALGVGVK